MTRITLTALLSAALALASIAPAQAQMTNDQLTRLLLGVATVGAIGIAIDKARDDKKDKERDREKEREKERERAQDRAKGWDGKDTRHGRYHREERDDRDRRGATSRVLPADCAHLVEGRGGQVHRVLGKDCLDRTLRHTERLPDRCADRVFAFGRHRDVYDAWCLQQSGWTVARHH